MPRADHPLDIKRYLYLLLIIVFVQFVWMALCRLFILAIFCITWVRGRDGIEPGKGLVKCLLRR